MMEFKQIFLKDNSSSCLRLLFVSLCFLISINAFAQKTRVQGRVFDENNKPLAGVLVLLKGSNEVLSATDDDGRFIAFVALDKVLVFESMTTKTKEVALKGKQEITVVLEAQNILLPDVEVVSKLKNKIIPEPTDIEVKGNYFHLRTRVRVPQNMSKSNTRLVIQPYLENVTHKERKELRPLVMDGREYSITQKRMYGFDLNKDPLTPYLYKDTANKTDFIPYRDSIYIENLKDDYRAQMIIVMENYRKAYYQDSFIIANGTVNPLRFFNYSLSSNSKLDSTFIPKPAFQLCQDKGEVRLIFKPSQEKIDLTIDSNLKEVQNLKDRLADIEVDPSSTLKSFQIHGTASPDGDYNKNVTLSKARMNEAGKVILSQISSQTKQFLSVLTDAHVASWLDVCELMEKDSLNEVADLKNIIHKYPQNITKQGKEIRKLSYYRSLIVEKYLPTLRRVAYHFEYSVFRTLNNEEIKEMYRKDPSKLTRYEYYRLFEMTQDTVQLRKLCSEALKNYPKFVYAANQLACLNLEQNIVDVDLLAPFIDEKASSELVRNQILILLQASKYSEAYELETLLPENVENEDVRNVVDILNGNYSQGYQKYAGTNTLNEVVLLLAMKRNQEAWIVAQKLSDDLATHEYVKAIAANRLDKVGMAIMYLENAISMDPHLKDVASIDGDVKELLE